MEGDWTAVFDDENATLFQSTLSAWRATTYGAGDGSTTLFQSTLSKRRATIHARTFHNGNRISIHVLRMESDIQHLHCSRYWLVISIHALHMESDSARDRMVSYYRISIHALRMRATIKIMMQTDRPTYFNPRSPNGGRLIDDETWTFMPWEFQSTLYEWRTAMYRKLLII